MNEIISLNEVKECLNCLTTREGIVILIAILIIIGCIIFLSFVCNRAFIKFNERGIGK